MMGKVFFSAHNKGFTLIEVTMVVGISSILLSIFAMLSTTMSKSLADSIGNADVASYRTELRTKLRSLEKSGLGSQSNCKAMFQSSTPLISPSKWDEIIQSGMADPTVHTDAEIEKLKRDYKVDLSQIDLLTGQTSQIKKYGDLHLIRSNLSGFILVGEKRAFRQSMPGEFNFNSSASQVATYTYLIQAELNVEMSKSATPQNESDILKMMPLRLNFAIRKAAGQVTELINCDHRSLDEVIAPMQICEALGADFVFVYDNFDGRKGGQCYAPIYDPDRPPNSFSASHYLAGSTAQVTGYMPLRQFFCEFERQGRGMDFRFCTGEY